MPIREEWVSRPDDQPLRRKLYQSNRTDSNLITTDRFFFMLEPHCIDKIVVVYPERNRLIHVGSV